LGDSQFHLCQPPPQIVLARNGFARDQFEYLPLPEPFLAYQSLTCRTLCICLHNYADSRMACQ
jgi:hypothetical protein